MILILENSGILAAAASSGEVTVYWVSNGIVFHLDKNCASLSRSKNILEGTIAESKKPRVCKICGHISQDDGVTYNGWKKIGNAWYYFQYDGTMQKGWLKTDGKWYYFSDAGKMQIGWQQISNKWYHFNASGQMQTGWQQIGNVWYYFNGGGDMATGWRTVGGKTYYFKDSGVMASNEWCKGYWLNADGTWTYKYKATWRKNSKGWWYGDESGWYAKNQTVRIDGKNYTFDANGYMK